MSDGIDIPIATPGASEALREMKALREAVLASAAAIDKNTKALDDQGKKSTEAAKKTQSLKDAIVDAGKAYAAGAALVGGFAVAVVGAAAKVLQAAGAHEQEMRAVNALSSAYARVQEATAGTVSAQDALRAQQSLTQSGIKMTAAEFEAIARKARDYALATGTDTTQALDQLTDALRGGEAEGLRKFGIAVDSTKSRTQNFHKATGDLIKAQKDQKVAQATLNEELGKTPRLLTSVINGMADAIAKSFGLAGALGKVNAALQEIGDIQKQNARDQENLALRDRRIALNTKIQEARARGVTDETIGTVDTTHMTAEQIAKYEQIFSGFRGQSAGERFRADHGMGTSNVFRDYFGADMEVSDATRLGRKAESAAELNARIAREMAAANVTNTTIRAEMVANDAASLARANGQETFGAGGGGGSGGGGSAPTGPDRADIVEQMRAITRLRARRGFAINADGTLNVDEFAQRDGESVQRYIERVAGAMEARFVDVDSRLIRKRGESEFEFAQRRIELTQQSLDTIAEREKAHTERIRQEEKARQDAVLAAARQRSEPIEQALRGTNRERLAGGFNEDTLEALKSGGTSVDDIRARITGLRDKALGETPTDATPEAVEQARIKVEAYQQEANALAGVVSAYQDYQDAQARAADYGKQFADAFKSNADLTATGAQALAKTAGGAFNTLTSAFKTHIGAVMQGKESIGEALRAITNETLTSLAQESVVQALFQTAQGFGALATYRYPEAVQHFTSAGIFAAVAAAAGIGAAATAAPASAASAGASANAGAGGGRVPPSNNSRNDSGGNVTNIINYNGTSFTTTSEMEQFLGRGLNTMARNGNTPRAFSASVMRTQGM